MEGRSTLNIPDISCTGAAPPLFVTDRQLRDLVAPHIGIDRFRSILRALEPKGFSRVSTQFRARDYPAVCAWFDQRYGVASHGVAMAEGGPENWDAPPKRGRCEAAR